MEVRKNLRGGIIPGRQKNVHFEPQIGTVLWIWDLN